MSKGDNTRSGLLWEVERLLNETEHLPQLMLMENVPQVHGKKNLADFEKWIAFLEEKGYSNYWQDLNAKDYGVAQSRNRCFMVSILGDYFYSFPKPQKLVKSAIKDYLEDKVDEKYYLKNEKAQELLKKLLKNGTIPQPSDRALVELTTNNPKTREIADCIVAKYDTGIGNRKAEKTGVVECKKALVDLSLPKPKARDIVGCITARYDSGISYYQTCGNTGVMECENHISCNMSETTTDEK